jgi:hypothetical protein
MSVVDSHNITKGLKLSIRRRFPDSVITIHIEPCDGECADICATGCLLAEDKKPKFSKISPELKTDRRTPINGDSS